MINKIILVFLSICIVFCSFCIPVSSAGSVYTEYYQYNGQAISSSVAEILSGYALNALRQSPELYRYWVAFRIDSYKYAICLFSDIDSYSLNKDTLKATVNDGCVMIYDQRLSSYQTGTQIHYQAGLYPLSDFNAPFTLQFTRGYVIGNVDGTISVNSDAEISLYFDYFVYILYTLIIFLFLFVAFKFLNKRWLLP